MIDIDSLIENAMHEDKAITNIHEIVKSMLDNKSLPKEIILVISRINAFNHSLYKTAVAENKNIAKAKKTPKKVLSTHIWDSHLNTPDQKVKKPITEAHILNSSKDYSDYRTFLSAIWESYDDAATIAVFLDSIQKSKREKYIDLILAELERNRIWLKWMFYETNNPFELDAYSQEEGQIMMAIDAIDGYLEMQEEDVEVTIPPAERKIVFYCDDNEIPYILQDANSYDLSYYQDFLDMINDFEFGHNKSIKKVGFASNKVMQIRGKTGRIILEQMDKKFIVLGGFLKKTQVRGIRDNTRIKAILNRYKENAVNFKNKLTNDEYIRIQEVLLTHVKKTLELQEKVR